MINAQDIKIELLSVWMESCISVSTFLQKPGKGNTFMRTN